MSPSINYPGQYKFRLNSNERQHLVLPQNKRPKTSTMSTIKHLKQRTNTRQRISKFRENKVQQRNSSYIYLQQFMVQLAIERYDT